MRTAQGRRSFDQLEAIGKEDADQRAALDIEHPLDLSTVGRHPLERQCAGSGALVADRELVWLSVIQELHHDARGLRAEADHLAIAAGPRRARGATKVDGLKQVGLAGAVGPMHNGQSLSESCLGASVGAEVAHLDADDPHVSGPRRSARGVWRQGQAGQGRRERGVLCTRATEDAEMRRP